MQPQWGLIDNQYNSQHWTLTGAQNGACWNGACGHSHPIELSTFWGCSYTRESLPTTLCEGTVPAALWPISLLFSTALIVQYYLIVSLFDCVLLLHYMFHVKAGTYLSPTSPQPPQNNTRHGEIICTTNECSAFRKSWSGNQISCLGEWRSWVLISCTTLTQTARLLTLLSAPTSNPRQRR